MWGLQDNALAAMLVSTLCFGAIRGVTNLWPAPSRAKSKAWLWRNTLVSLVHSSVVGILAVACFSEDTEMRKDLAASYTKPALWIICIFMGYTLYDAIDMLLNSRSRQTAELLFHHFLILFCSGASVVSRIYIGYLVGGLYIEINSVFLHLHHLMKMADVSKRSRVYTLVSLLNIGTCVVFRLWTNLWLMGGLLGNLEHPKVSSYVAFISFVGLLCLLVINILLLMRLVKGFVRDRAAHSSGDSVANGGTFHMHNDKFVGSGPEMNQNSYRYENGDATVLKKPSASP